MKPERQTQFGRQMPAVQTSEITLVDKWKVLQDLSEGAGSLGLNHRTLGVLRALLTFHPDRLIGPEPLSAVVFPSNRTLSHRLNGMPESTLRRHLNKLVASGVVIRRDSANRKRFKRRAGDAYGFDLAPLAQNATYIATIANDARDLRDRLANLRDRIAQSRQMLLDINGPCALTEEARMILRRKPDEAALLGLNDALNTKINALEADQMSTADTQNERHIQPESLNILDNTLEKKQTLPVSNDIVLSDILDQCKEYRLYFPSQVRHWNDAFDIASRLSRMIGIEGHVFEQVLGQIGKKPMVAIIFQMLDKLPNISNPGGYLRRCAQNKPSLGIIA